MKKMIVFALALMILALFAFPALYAAKAPLTLTVEENITAVPGGKFSVSVSVANNPGITVMDFSAKFDSSKMTLESIEFADFLTGDENVVCETSGRRFTISSGSEAMKRNGVYLTLNFRLSSEAGLGSYKIEIAAAEHGVLDENGKALDYTAVSGGVKLDCIHNYVKTVVKPTCSSEGYTEYHCTECSVKYISDYVEKLDHKWKTKSVVEATCTEDGKRVIVCTVCGEEVTEKYGEAKGHNYGEEIVIEPTCQHGGHTVSICTVCGEEFIVPGTQTDKTDHKMVETFSKMATCSETGFRQETCQYCGLIKITYLPMIDHKWEATIIPPTHDSGGWTLFTCKNCGISKREGFTEKLPYDYDYTVTKEPTCEESGERVGICKDGCGATVTETLPPLGHQYSEWVCVRKASVISGAKWESVCLICGKVITQTGDAIPETAPEDTPSAWTLDYWKNLAVRAYKSTRVRVIAAIVVFLILLIIIIILLIKSNIKRKKNRSARELTQIAVAVASEPPVRSPDLPDKWQHKDDELGIPDRNGEGLDFQEIKNK